MTYEVTPVSAPLRDMPMKNSGIVGLRPSVHAMSDSTEKLPFIAVYPILR